MFNIVIQSFVEEYLLPGLKARSNSFHMHKESEFDSPLSWPIEYDVGASNSICHIVVIFLYPRSVPLCCIRPLPTEMSTLESCTSSLMPLFPRATHPRSPKASVSAFLSNPSTFFHLFSLDYYISALSGGGERKKYLEIIGSFQYLLTHAHTSDLE